MTSTFIRGPTSVVASGGAPRRVESYMPVVRRLAARLKRELPASVEFDDLFQDGMVGVATAIARIGKQVRGMLIDAYVTQRVLGAMLDGLRANDVASRRVRRIMRAVDEASHRLCHRLGRRPSEGELADELGMSIARLQEVRRDADLSVPEPMAPNGDSDVGDSAPALSVASRDDPYVMVHAREVCYRVMRAFERLPPAEQAVLTAYYQDGRSMREIGAAIRLSEGRVSQLHSHAVRCLRCAAE